MNKKALGIVFLFISILIIFVALPKILFIKGKSCYDNENVICATDYFQRAHTLAPTNLEYEYYYTKSLTKLKPTYKIQKIMFTLSKHARSNSAMNLANSTINEWKLRFIGALGSNYIEQAPLDTEIVHWNINSFPLNVYIKEADSVPDYYNIAIKNAFALWSNAVSFLLFSYTNNESDAQIIIEIKQLPENYCVSTQCQYVTGFTTPNRSGHQLKSMSIVLYDKDPSGSYYSEKEIFHTIAHELGHALGIMGHSYNSEDLMYSTKNKTATMYDEYKHYAQTLSNRDVNTIKLLYLLEPTVTDHVSDDNNLIYAPIILGSKDDILNRKILEAQNYINKSPDISSGYIDLASAYLQKNDTKAAEKTLIKALNYAKSNDEFYIIYYNLSIVACTAKRFNKAQEYLNKAKEINNTPELNEIQYLIDNKILPVL